MKIIYKKGNLIECDETYILHGCNAQGVMGSGVAKAIREHFPEAYEVYMKDCRIQKELTGYVNLGDFTIAQSGSKKIINLITQQNYGRDGQLYVNYRALRSGLRMINNVARSFSGQSIAMPKIGAGLGGGDWSIISEIIEETSTNYQPVVYEL